MNRLKVGVLFGGNSSEHDISIASGEEVLRHLDRVKYRPFRLFINRDGSFDFPLPLIREMDVVFIALHGSNGEDGVIQGFLDTLKIRYTGSPLAASNIGINKIYSKLLWSYKGIPTVPFNIVSSISACREYNLPFVLKPSSQGSSLGVGIVDNLDQVRKVYEKAATFGDAVMLEPYISGLEITIGVLGNEKPYALPIVAIVPKNKFFDYEAKYKKGFADEIVPAKIPRKTALRAQHIAVEAFKSLGCRGFGRVDMFICSNEHILVSEINTIPGFTANSLLPKAAKASGITMFELIDRIIRYAIPIPY